MKCPHCTNENPKLLEPIADVSLPSEPRGTALQILCAVCARSYIHFKAAL